MTKLHVTIASLAEAAAPDALSPREWEALGRAAVLVEECAGNAEAFVEDAQARGDTPMEFAASVIRSQTLAFLEEAGLEPADWRAFPRPVLPAREPAPVLPLRWIVDVRLAVRTGKSGRPEVDHAPTLAEQHGAAKKT